VAQGRLFSSDRGREVVEMAGARYLRLLAAVSAAGVVTFATGSGVAQGAKPARGCPDSFALINVRDAFDALVDFNADGQICAKPLPSGTTDENVIDNTSNH
jgi:hypothetical protein